MRRHFRASALAAAAFSFFAFTSFVEPTLASEAAGEPGQPFTAHAGIAIQALDLGLNDFAEVATSASPTTEPAPVFTHASAPALPDVSDDAMDEPADQPADERRGRTLTQLVADYAGTETPDEEIECLARAVYYESKGEPLSGQLTVAEVIINRAESGRFASTLCGVVRQRGQFSFVRGGVIPVPPRASRDWRTAVAIAQIATRDLADGAAPSALFFHARHVSPGWRRTRVATVGNHVFYR